MAWSLPRRFAQDYPVVMNDLDNLKSVYTTGCIKSDFSDYETSGATIARLLTDPVAYNHVKPTPEDIHKLRLHWDWQNRCAEFQRFLAEERV
jgi:hypothetical protein